MAPARARPTIQPSRNAGPFVRARGVPSINTTAMIGTGLIVTPTASDRIWPTASPMLRAYGAPERSWITRIG